MSKGLGQKIGIKFTEDLVGDVSGKGTVTPYSFTDGTFYLVQLLDDCTV